MSMVTDVVFVTPDWAAAKRFEDVFERFPNGRSDSTWRPAQSESNGTKVSGTYVYHLGVNYLDWDFAGAVRAESWPAGTVFYVYGEDDDAPRVTVWNGGEVNG
jgi:hypothetical protein